ncbi:MAG: hypothetical protein EP305_04245 [Bacteroidetes bacterium]|nr:MAG: hypothetical protein EP305_04245 [Bacteroidota bacterium]
MTDNSSLNKNEFIHPYFGTNSSVQNIAYNQKNNSNTPIKPSENRCFNALVGIRNISDYSPFGVLLKERTVEGAFFRQGFQGQEHDDEVKGNGNSINFKYRMHDPRVGRFFAVDLLSKEYPWYTPYSFSGNEVTYKIEFEGLEPADNKLTSSNVGKSFIGVSHAKGQEGLKYYWKLCANPSKTAMWWEQGNKYIPPPQVKKIDPLIAELQSYNQISDNNSASNYSIKINFNLINMQRKSGAQQLMDEAWNKGDFGGYLRHWARTWDSESTGEKGLYERGIPLMAATAGTILTFGSGSLVSGSFAGAAANGTGNFIGQWAQTKDIGQVDLGSSLLAAGGGLMKNPWIATTTTSVLDAGIDVKINSGFNTIGSKEKSWSQGFVDLGFGMIGGSQSNLIKKSGISNNVMNSRSLIIGGLQQYGNSQVNDQLNGNK